MSYQKMSYKKRIREISLISGLLTLASVGIAWAAAVCQQTSADPCVGSTAQAKSALADTIDVIHVDSFTACKLGGIADVYATFMNVLVIAIMIFFTFVMVKHIMSGIALSSSHNANQMMDENTPTSWGVVRVVLTSILETGGIALIILFVAINGIGFMTDLAIGSQGLFSIDCAASAGRFFGPFSKIADVVQSYGSLLIIVIGVPLAVIKGLMVLKADKLDNYSGAMGGMGFGGASKYSQFSKTKQALSEIGGVLVLVLLGFLAIRLGPEILTGFFGGLSSLYSTSTSTSGLGMILPAFFNLV